MEDVADTEIKLKFWEDKYFFMRDENFEENSQSSCSSNEIQDENEKAAIALVYPLTNNSSPNL
jgi:hypothetical protein